jgi:hypothetical protein
MRRLVRMLERAHAVLSHDFCPSMNGWVYWMKHPLASIWAAATVALICGIWVNPYALLLLAALAGIAGLGVAWPWIAARGISGRVSFPQPRVRAGERALVRIEIHNRLPWPVWGLSLRRGFVRGSDAHEGIALARVNGFSTVQLEWSFVPEHRGVYPFQEPRLDTGFPFGLFHATAAVDVVGELIVWPRSVALDALPDAMEIHSREDRLADRRVGDCGDMIGTRPFRPGDSLRRVHWRQTARHGRLIVTERQAPADSWSTSPPRRTPGPLAFRRWRRRCPLRPASSSRCIGSTLTLSVWSETPSIASGPRWAICVKCSMPSLGSLLRGSLLRGPIALCIARGEI